MSTLTSADNIRGLLERTRIDIGRAAIAAKKIAFDIPSLALLERKEKIADLLDRYGFIAFSDRRTLNDQMEDLFSQMDEGTELADLKQQWQKMKEWLSHETANMQSWTNDRERTEMAREKQEPNLLVHGDGWQVLETALKLHEESITELTSRRKIDRVVADQVVSAEHQLQKLFEGVGVRMQPAAQGAEGADARALQYYEIVRQLREKHNGTEERGVLIDADADLCRNEESEKGQVTEPARAAFRQPNIR